MDRPIRSSRIGASRNRSGRKWIIATAVVVLGLFAAWFDGGEEPVHPIIQQIDVPESGQ